MLCSVPASKSGSNWLDRLRSNKGFPTGDNLDLDHFLDRNPNSSSEFPNANASASSESTRPDTDRVANRSESSYQNRDNEGQAFIGLMDSVLSELFFMGGSDESSKLSRRKIPRKQTNPRVCVASTTSSNSNGDTATEEKSLDCVRNDENAIDKTGSLSSDNRSLVENKKELGNVDGGECEEEEEEEEEKGEMKGYSRSEVTVIDTSCGVWKTEKLVFRRKNVWKVREKKVRVRSFGRHKRKVVDEDEVGVQGVGDIDKKKAKVSALEEADGDECIALKCIEGQNPQNDTRREVCEDTPDKLNERGFSLKRSPRKMKKGDSSVVLIKGIPTENKNGGKLPRKCLKDNQKQYKG